MQKIKRWLISILSILTVILMGLFSSRVFASPAFAFSPSLGALDSYSVLGGSTVTNTGLTTISGVVGVSPGSEITGFPPGVSGGALHSADSNAANAQTANAAVFNSLNQACDQTFGSADLSTTFPAGIEPGVYCSTSNFSLSGNLNLIGSGVWIFRTASTLDTSSGSSITGGNPCNIWWQVGSSATLGTNTSFEGNILALVSITLNTGTSLNGRALAQTGAVSLDENSIFGPYCVEAPIATNTLITSPAETETPTDTETATPLVTSQPSLTETPLPTPTDTLIVSPTLNETIQATEPETATVVPSNTLPPTLSDTPENTATTLSTIDPSTPTISPTETLSASETPTLTTIPIPTLTDTPENTATDLPTTDPTTPTLSNPQTATAVNTVIDPTEITATTVEPTTQQTGLPTRTPVRSAHPANVVVTPTLLPIVRSLPDSGGAPIRDETLPWALSIIISFGIILVAIRL